MDYNETVNLPKTDFPMRASLPQREPGMLQEWNENEVYETLLKLNADKPPYILHDGPPFSNGNIHMGTAMNKVLKDFVNRHKMMTGHYVPYVPGWDNHGMPIESAIIKKNKLDRSKMSIPDFRNACRDFAMKYVNIQRDQFIRLGVLGDWEHPYLTLDPAFEAEEVKVFGKLYEKGYIYKGLKPVYWCPKDETALAEAEIEYQEDPCVSIYVKFAVKNDGGKLSKLGGKDNTYFIIWTTTTWTLPGNLAIAVHPRESYVLAQTSTGERYIVAEALLERTMAAGGVTGFKVLGRFTGEELEYMTTQHPFLDRESVVVLAEYVTMESGTGCVHTAPGFGADDFITGQHYNLKMIVPVDDKGYQTADAGKFAGLKYDESNQAILDDMEQTGALFAKEKITHTYPHCWRCKEPIIFRATPQWFCSVDAFKDAAITAAHNVEWIPAWGEERLINMIRDRSDWCISRQRHWGLPIPVFYCSDCSKPVCNEESIEITSRLFAQEGSNAWYIRDASDILPEGFVCPHCGSKHFFKETDTLDGWFDSGSTNICSLEKDEPKFWPADMYLEGADQYRGWFQSSLLAAVGAKDQGAPYKTVMTHGWVVDGEGKAMHKSLGNTVDPDDVIKEYGADILRLWVASSDYHADVRVSKEIFKQLSQAYLKIRNTMRYMLGNLDGFDPDQLVAPEEMPELDRWVLTRLKQLTERVLEAYNRYEQHIVYHSIYDFCVVDLSNFYLDVIKDRLYCEQKDGILRRSAQTAMFLILDAMSRMLAPILAFTADEVWKVMPHPKSDDPRNVMFNQMSALSDKYALSEADQQRWEKLIALRDDVNVALESARAQKVIGKPLEACVTLYCQDEEQAARLALQAELLRTLFIVSQVDIKTGEGGESCRQNPGIGVATARMEGEKCQRCWNYDDSVGENSEHPTLCARCAQVVGAPER